MSLPGLCRTGTKPPYYVGLLVGDTEDAPLYHLGDSDTTQFLW